ncbi:MAG: universal stress protein [Desulfomonilaceae bacterium]
MLPKKILFCTDFSENSEPARRCALEYAKAFGSAVSIVHVIATWPVHTCKVTIDEEGTVSCSRDPELVGLESVSRQFVEVLSDVTTCVKVGNPAQEIVRYANEESVDLIVMGTRGWTGFVHVMLGSVAEAVIRTANCPVLIVRSFFGETVQAETSEGTAAS